MAVKKKKPQTLKKINHNLSIENNYKKKLTKFQNKVLNSFEYWTLAAFNKKQRGEVKDLSKELKATFSELISKWEKEAMFLSQGLATRTMVEVMKYVDSRYKVRGIKVKENNNLKQVKKAWILDNIALIKSIPSDVLRRFESSFYNSINSFNQESLYKKLRTIRGISKRKCYLIARDQVSKSIENYQISVAKEAGFKYFVWSTSQDERVSKEHKILNNRIFSYENPTAIIDSYKNVGIPAQRVNCRCTAIPLILNENEKLKKVRDTKHGDYFIVI